MLRRLELKAQWRSLGTDSWPSNIPFGNRTVIYGHNGSGKSTLSELLLSLSDGECATDVVWEDEDGKRIPVSANTALPSTSMSVFTHKWVDENLSAFLDGDRAAAIVTLGKEAIDAKDEESRLSARINELRTTAEETKNQLDLARRATEKLARGVLDRIVADLSPFDHARFTKHQFTIKTIRASLRAHADKFPDHDAYAEALRYLQEPAPTRIDQLIRPPSLVAVGLNGLATLLTETPTRAAIPGLEDDTDAQKWAEEGIRLHQDLDHCLYCAGEITEERKQKLNRHFDASWHEIRQRTVSLAAKVGQARIGLADWLDRLPSTTAFAPEHHQAVALARDQIGSEVSVRLDTLREIEKSLAAKADNPSSQPAAPGASILKDPLPINEFTSLIDKHNSQVDRQEEITGERIQTVLDHILGSEADSFVDLEHTESDWSDQHEKAGDEMVSVKNRLDSVRAAQFTTKDMADTLTRDLARVYGKSHLSVAVTADGKSYECRRGNDAATDLSVGERTTLSLLYFLRGLQDEQDSGVDPSQRIVIIDDPSSSLDRESLFATHQWLVDSLSSFGQYVVLTHDFSLLRLFIGSQRRAWAASNRKSRDGDVQELRFPRVAFLELFAVADEGERRSKLSQLPDLLRTNTSEYAYLFSMVMAGIEDSEDQKRLFLLPNAARRVLEVFASYKAPHRPNFRQQLEFLTDAGAGEPFRDVYDFCNRFSHGEGTESVDVLDARTVQGQISRCMQFLRALDCDHFERMCKATGANSKVLR